MGVLNLTWHIPESKNNRRHKMTHNTHLEVQAQLREQLLLYCDELLVQCVTLLRSAQHKHLHLAAAAAAAALWVSCAAPRQEPKTTMCATISMTVMTLCISPST
jgi:hypothetical protein